MIGDAADRHERPPAGVAHGGKEGPSHMKGRPQVHRDLLIELVGRRGLERFEQEGAGIAHHDLGDAVIGQHPCRRAFDRYRIGHVAPDVVIAVVAAGGESAGHADDPRAGALERGGDGRSDAA